MGHTNRKVVELLRAIDLGAGIAEQDTLLESARVDTSAFDDLLNDKVDLIPGTKGSGKTALYRIVVDFTQLWMLERKRVVVAHGVRQHGDQVFQVFRDRFGQLSEEDFVSFWCVYFVSLANEHFVKDDRFSTLLSDAVDEVYRFKSACTQARIPSFEGKRTLRDVLDWALDAVLARVKPKQINFSHAGTGTSVELLFPEAGLAEKPVRPKGDQTLPAYTEKIKNALEDILVTVDLNLWLMIDRLDEIFPRRSELETKALRGLLRVIRIFESPRMRVKVFLRDDILEQIVEGKGFTALTHVAARRAKPLMWTEEQILCLLVKRFFSHRPLAKHFEIETGRLNSVAYSRQAFYRIFPKAVYRGEGRIPTVRWIYSRCADGRGVVTPRDVINLVTRAIQHQLDHAKAEIAGRCDVLIEPVAIREGFESMSREKTVDYLKAEFPLWWPHIEKFKNGTSAYTYAQLERLFGTQCDRIIKDLVSIGVLATERRRVTGITTYRIPFLYRPGLEANGRMRY